jgi:hypothetical protein
MVLTSNGAILIQIKTKSYKVLTDFFYIFYRLYLATDGMGSGVLILYLQRTRTENKRN